MKKLRIIIIIPAIILVALLSGCIKINISTGIDADFTAFLSYHIELDVSDVDSRYHGSLSRALNEIGWHYQEELNFIADLNIETAPFLLTMTRRLQNNTFEQAYNSLEFLLTNEDMTPFMIVDMAIQAAERHNMYILNASTDIPHIMSLSNAEDLSPALREQLDLALKTGEGEITITMPAGDLVNSTHQTNTQRNQTVMIVPLSYTEQTAFELTGTVNLLRDGTIGGSLEEIIEDQYRLRNIVFIASIAISGLLLIIILVIFLKRKRTEDA